MPAAPTPPRNPNRLPVTFRQWHSWGGLLLSGFILLVAATGILLNHKDAVFHRGQAGIRPTGLLTASTDLAAIPVGPARALALAREHFGDAPLEKLELKDERGRLIYKVSRGEGQELRIDARTGAVASKYGVPLGKAGAGDGRGGLNWAKLVDDLHTGKILGSAGKLLIDLTSGVIIALTLTGIYLWAVPRLRKRRSRTRQAASPPPVPSSVATSDRLARIAERRAAARRAALAASDSAAGAQAVAETGA